MQEWQRNLLEWYDQNKRDLPWRHTRDPYCILVSEAMCQQTQVATVIPYYERWIAKFPTVEALALAELSTVFEFWAGLGYYRRAANLHLASQVIAGSGFPKIPAEILRLPGVGAYTAGAVGSICFDLPTPAVDGNVMRVAARFLAKSSSSTTDVTSWATHQMVKERPGDWNQALMELGARICTPRNPECQRCPIATDCLGKRTGDPAQFSPRKARAPQETMEVAMTVYVCGNEVCVRQFRAGEWWQGLWGFSDELDTGHVSIRSQVELETIRFVVTRYRITARVTLIELNKRPASGNWVLLREAAQLAMPAPHKRVLKQIQKSPLLVSE